MVTDLTAGWEFRQHVEGASTPTPAWRPATVPGDVHLDLLANKLIPEPFFRDNEAKLQWISDAGWEYRTTLQATPELLRRKHAELVFDGLDAYAQVYLNGHLLLTADNMFRQWRVDLKPALKGGGNELLVVFPSPLKIAPEIAARDHYHGQTPAPDKSYLRKAAYEYGWDWGPTFVTSGIWRPVHLESWNEARIADLFPRQRELTAALARVNVEVDVVASEAGKAAIAVSYTAPGGKPGELSVTTELAPGTNHLVVPVEIRNPQLWYPNGYGAQPLYTFGATVKTGSQEQDHAERRIGLRTLVLRRDLDQWGRSFELQVNGVPIFAKGADVIPFDSFPSRVTTAQYRRILQSAKDANMNMIRHWGGGYYETDEFYSLCDELGIMVWQDFMFGNDWQPGTYSFRENVEQEAEEQVTRLRNHPSIVIWCGNNETEESLGWEKNAATMKTLNAEQRVKVWQDYLLLFSGTLPRVVERLDPQVPYWPSSPSADYEYMPPGNESGDMHDWSVWHERQPFSTYEKHFPRFMTEYGFQSFPEMKTIEAFTDPEDRTSIFTPVMLAHQKNDEGNSIIHDHLLKDYAEPKDFASLLYASQVLQAEGIKLGTEHLRRSRPRTMGAIYWQLNDCWPVASWSSIDYYGRWKALQFYARRFFAPLLVSPHLEEGSLAVWVVSDKTAPTSAQLRTRIMKFDGTIVRESSEAVQIPALSSARYQQMPLAEFIQTGGNEAAGIFAAVQLTVGGQVASSNVLYLLPTKEIHLPPAQIQTELIQSGSGYQLTLRSPVLARSVYLSAPVGSSAADDMSFSDNYFDLLPNEPVTVTMTSKAALEAVRAALKVRSLADAFAAPGSSPAPTAQ